MEKIFMPLSWFNAAGGNEDHAATHQQLGSHSCSLTPPSPSAMERRMWKSKTHGWR